MPQSIDQLDSASRYPRVKFSRSKLSEICRRWQIIRFELHGSVVRDDFDPMSSDVDCLVTFKEGVQPRLLELGAIQQSLEDLFGHRVDLHTRDSIERMQNVRIRDTMLQGAVDVTIE